MDLGTLILVLIIAAVCFALFPMDEGIKRIIRVVLAVLVLIWILSIVGAFGHYPIFPNSRIH